jgi:hypothetical protein
MRALYSLPIALAAIPAGAHAACEPSFVSTTQTVVLIPTSLDGGPLIERFDVRVRNDGDTTCTLRLAIGREQGPPTQGFPNFSLTGPGGNIPVVPVQAATSNPNTRVNITIPAGQETVVSYEVRINVGWGDEAGNLEQELVHLLLPENGNSEFATARTILSLTVPLSVRVRFAGAFGENGPATVEMGLLSPTATTYSPPFAIRVLSNSRYRMDLVSQNAGALVRVGGTERVPYQMTVGSMPVNLAGAGAVINVPTRPGVSGDVHPVSIAIGPDAERHAGDYSDRVTVTVTAI